MVVSDVVASEHVDEQVEGDVRVSAEADERTEIAVVVGGEPVGVAVELGGLSVVERRMIRDELKELVLDDDQHRSEPAVEVVHFGEEAEGAVVGMATELDHVLAVGNVREHQTQLLYSRYINMSVACVCWTRMN
jgi:hypothetical protein